MYSCPLNWPSGSLPNGTSLVNSILYESEYHCPSFPFSKVKAPSLINRSLYGVISRILPSLWWPLVHQDQISAAKGHGCTLKQDPVASARGQAQGPVQGPDLGSQFKCPTVASRRREAGTNSAEDAMKFTAPR